MTSSVIADQNAVVLEVFDFTGVLGLSEDQFRGGGFGLFRDLRRGKERVRGGGGCSDEGGSEEREDYFPRVREEEHYYVVLLHAEFLKTGGDFTGRGVNVGI